MNQSKLLKKDFLDTFLTFYKLFSSLFHFFLKKKIFSLFFKENLCETERYWFVEEDLILNGAILTYFFMMGFIVMFLVLVQILFNHISTPSNFCYRKCCEIFIKKLTYFNLIFLNSENELFQNELVFLRFKKSSLIFNGGYF
jgi:hypothetical protein